MSKVSAHSHIRGLGLNDQGSVDVNDHTCGFIGQHEAREACGLIVDLIQSKKLSGRGLLLVGAPGTGKTALALAVSQELSQTHTVPFVPIVGSEVYSSEVKKTEMIMSSIRRAMGLSIQETKDVYEGEVTQLHPVEAKEGDMVVVSHVMLTLKSTQGSKTLKLDPAVFDQCIKEKVTVGDIVYIESNSGSVKRLGRSDAYAQEYDLEADEYVPLPKGPVHHQKQVLQFVTLHDLDQANARPQLTSQEDKLLRMLRMEKPFKKTEVTDKLRHEIDRLAQEQVNQGHAEWVPGVLFIDEAHMLDVSCFSYLMKVMESSLAPVIILATNRGACPLRGLPIETITPHGMPVDFLDRLLILKTTLYNLEEIKSILTIKSKTEQVQLSEEALLVLSDLAYQHTSLRYALQLLAPLALTAQAYQRSQVEVEDIELVKNLFLDVKRAISA